VAADAVSYRIYVAGVLYDTVPGQPSVELEGFTAGSYSVQTSSVDAAGNESALSPVVTVVVTGVAVGGGGRMLKGQGS
jgi:hypothetical protein